MILTVNALIILSRAEWAVGQIAHKSSESGRILLPASSRYKDDPPIDDSFPDEHLHLLERLIDFLISAHDEGEVWGEDTSQHV